MPRTYLIQTALLFLLLLPIFIAGISPANADEEAPLQSSYLLQRSVMGAAGSPCVSANFQSNGTLGQPTPIGMGLSEEKVLDAGFWRMLWLINSGVDPFIPIVFKNELRQNFPNPFQASTNIRFSIAEQGRVQITIYDIAGRAIRTLANHLSPPGIYNIAWDGRNDSGDKTSSGIYLYKLETDSFSAVRKMLVLK